MNIMINCNRPAQQFNQNLIVWRMFMKKVVSVFLAVSLLFMMFVPAYASVNDGTTAKALRFNADGSFRILLAILSPILLNLAATSALAGVNP